MAPKSIQVDATNNSSLKSQITITNTNTNTNTINGLPCYTQVGQLAVLTAERYNFSHTFCDYLPSSIRHGFFSFDSLNMMTIDFNLLNMIVCGVKSF